MDKDAVHHLDVGRRTSGFALCGLTILGAALRLWPIAARPLWHDEVMTWKAARTGLARIVTWQHHYEHPPLYYLLTWISMRVFAGDAEWVLRLPAAICGIACIPAMYFLARRVAGRSTGLLAAALVAMDFNAIIQSQQARMYTLTVLAVTLTLIALTGAIDRPGWRRWALVGTGLAASFAASHLGLILAAALPLALLAWLLWRREGDRPTPRARGVFAGLAVAYAVGLAWCSVGVVVMLQRLRWFSAKTAGSPWADRFAGLANDFAHAYASPWLAAAMLAVGVVGVALLIRRCARRRPLALVLLLLIVMNMLFALPVQPHGFEPRPRYVIVGQIALWIGAAYLATVSPRRAVRLALLAGAIVAMVWLPLRSLHEGTLPRYRLGDAIEELAPRVRPGDNVIYYPAWIDDNGVYYGLPPTHTPPTMEWGSDHTDLPWSISPTDRPTWLIIAYHHETGATDAAPDIVQHLADRYGVAINRPAVTAAVRAQPVVVVRIDSSGVRLIDPAGAAAAPRATPAFGGAGAIDP